MTKPNPPSQDSPVIQASCPHCGESIPAKFEVCWNCGGAVDGSYPPQRQPSPYAPPQALDEPPRPIRFRLAHLMLFVTSVSILLACATNEHALFIAVAVVITNVLGAVVGMFVTRGLGLPNDGSAPPGCEDEPAECEGPQRSD